MMLFVDVAVTPKTEEEAVIAVVKTVAAFIEVLPFASDAEVTVSPLMTADKVPVAVETVVEDGPKVIVAVAVCWMELVDFASYNVITDPAPAVSIVRVCNTPGLESNVVVLMLFT